LSVPRTKSALAGLLTWPADCCELISRSAMAPMVRFWTMSRRGVMRIGRPVSSFRVWKAVHAAISDAADTSAVVRLPRASE
jgi:hypothetical protein